MAKKSAEDLYRIYLTRQSEYDRFIRADPEMLAQTDEAKRLRHKVETSWQRYHVAKYGQVYAKGKGKA